MVSESPNLGGKKAYKRRIINLIDEKEQAKKRGDDEEVREIQNRIEHLRTLLRNYENPNW